MTTEIPPDTRLVVAAADLFYRKGYNAVGVNELCEAADVKKGSFYYFFDSKRALAEAGIAHLRELTERDVLRPAFADDVPPRARITRYFDCLAEWNTTTLTMHDEVLGCPFGNLAAEVGPDEDLIRAAVAEGFSMMKDHFRACLADAVAEGADLDPERGAEALLAFMEGVVLIARASGDPEDIRRLGNRAPDVAGL